MIYKQPKEATTELTYTRSGAATAWRKDGTLAEFAPNVIRRTDAGVLIEGQRTNLFPSSKGDTFANTPVFTVHGEQSPRGRMEATLINSTTSQANRYELILAPGTYPTGQKITASWFQKRKGFIGEGNKGTPSSLIAPTGHVNAAAVVPFKMRDAANGWEQWAATLTLINGAVESRLRLYFGGNNFVDQPANVVDPFAFWGIQFEAASDASSPIITAGAAATRGADSLVVSVPALSGPNTLIASAESLPDGGSLFRATSPDGFNNLSVSRQGGRVVLQIPGGQSTTAPAPGGPVKVTVSRDGGVYRWAMNGVVMPPLAFDPDRLKGGNQGFEDGLTGWDNITSGGPLSSAHGILHASYHGASNVFETPIGTRVGLFSQKAFPVDTSRKYRIRVRLYDNGAVPTGNLLGMSCRDEHKNVIGGNTGLEYPISLPLNIGWREAVSSVITGEKSPGANTGTEGNLKFRHGTKFIILAALLNWNATPDTSVAIDGIWLEDVTETDLPMDRVHAFPQLNSYGRELLTFPYALTDEELVKLTSLNDTTFDYLNPGGVYYYDAGQTAMPRKSQVVAPISSGNQVVVPISSGRELIL